MKVRTFDNLKFKKWRWVEIGLTLFFGIAAMVILPWNPKSQHFIFYSAIALFSGGICVGIGIQTFTETFYIKKQKESI